MKNFHLTICLLFSLSLTGQQFYDLNTIQTIEITFAQSNWDQLLDDEKAGEENYILAQSVSINGTVFDSVGVKYKGNSTYNANQTKNPFHIELDTYKDHDYQGYKDIKLSNVAKDPSFLREVLSYQILGQYMDAPLSNFTNVYVNGTLIGLYSNSEAISKTFVKDRFGSKSNTFIKCNPPAGAGPQSNDFPNLVYLGQDSSDYYDAYELKSDAGWQELIDLCDTLSNEIDAIESILDVDRALWMMAFNNVFVNLDSYLGAFSQNYYLYRDDYGRFIPVVWDLNESFGKFAMTGSGQLNGTAAMQRMSHLQESTNASYPLIRQLLANPTYKRMYVAHMKTMLLENFDNATYAATGEALQALIDDAVMADGNKFFTYANFISNLNSDISTGGGPRGENTPGITNLMDGRSDYLLGLTDFTAAAPSIVDPAVSEPSPVVGESVTVTAVIAGGSSVTLGYRSTHQAPFTKVTMFDDGANGDGAANDGIYGVSIRITGTQTEYFVYAENEDAGLFSPQRAEHEFHTIAATTSGVTAGDLVINEFMASNDATVADERGDFDDWIELYNNTSSPIDLTGYFLSDNPDNLDKYDIPEGTVIEGNGYLIIWADEDGDEQEGLHANFKLSAGGESVLLMNADTVIIDEVTYGEIETDISYARLPNGTGDFEFASPTFNAENTVVATANPQAVSIGLRVSPNPANGGFYLDFDTPQNDGRDLSIYDITGRMMLQKVIRGGHWIETADWKPGLYLVRVDSGVVKLVVE
ncbi:CotH kinase family protein [Neolewinella persica]|uniref:CotH kinase family protein n=1 Tax=Neolewinella persica TaxID=70998 RepID=UPI00037968FF|nr:CotH kinase family protein [Neolewinella persica]